MFMTSARMEAARIVRDAKDYAFTVASRSDVEYAEMMRHASEEAENLRAQSQQRLDQAHDTLKKALHRATEIIAEAHAEAARSNRPWYEAPPARLMDAEPAAPSAARGSHGRTRFRLSGHIIASYLRRETLIQQRNASLFPGLPHFRL